ncbi:MAG: hypothetical protein M0D55_12240 [Elusimicrobiota bacterium]|nr:MAG: hypothetical protein M0D55_12240 [Elusimicrobiota bacterium]
MILKALAGPATGWTAVERVQVFLPGKKPKAMKVNVSGLPQGNMRLEVLGRKKVPVLTQVRVAREAEAPEKGLARLNRFYELTVSTGGVVAKRKTWKIELRLKTGVLRRALWVDRDSGLLMKRETYRDDGSLRRRERLVKLEMPATVDPGLFLNRVPESDVWAPDGFISIKRDEKSTTFSNGLEAYTVSWDGKNWRVTGDIAEDDAERALLSNGRAL